MLLVILLSSILAQGQTQQNPSNAKILKYNSDNDGLGSYKFKLVAPAPPYIFFKINISYFSYVTDNGISYSEEGAVNEVTGSYQYTGPQGELVSVTYVANENGYRPKVVVQYKVGPAVPVSVPVGTPPPPPAYTPPVVQASLPVICSLLGGC